MLNTMDIETIVSIVVVDSMEDDQRQLLGSYQNDNGAKGVLFFFFW